MSDQAAHRLLQSARLVRDHDPTAAALAAGDITVTHVHALAAAARDRADAYTEHETTLVEAARTVEPRDFTAITRRWRELADDDASRRDAAFAFERRGLQLSPTTGGSADHERRGLAQRPRRRPHPRRVSCVVD